MPAGTSEGPGRVENLTHISDFNLHIHPGPSLETEPAVPISCFFPFSLIKECRAKQVWIKHRNTHTHSHAYITPRQALLDALLQLSQSCKLLGSLGYASAIDLLTTAKLDAIYSCMHMYTDQLRY